MPTPSEPAVSLPPALADRRAVDWAGLVRTWGPIACFGILWLDLIRQLSYTWDTREQYAYGWFVPFFALYLLWRRWSDRPAPTHRRTDDRRTDAPTHRRTDAPAHRRTRFGFRPSTFDLLLAVFCLLSALLLLPLRVIYEINADWPLIGWTYTGIAVGLTLYAFYLAGGWPWVRHFAFPVAFILVAVTWPYRIEKGLTQNLMQTVANITVEVLGALGIPALQKGNLIEVATGVVGVDEACSGIRSFQSTLMAGLLMGELYRLATGPRLVMVLLGLLLAFGFNIVRTLLLGWQASQHGLEVLDKWHDPAGLTITVACFFALWGLAGLFKRKWPVGERTEDGGQRTEDRGQCDSASVRQWPIGERTEDGGQRTEDRGQCDSASVRQWAAGESTEGRGQRTEVASQSNADRRTDAPSTDAPSTVAPSTASPRLSAFIFHPSALLNPSAFLTVLGLWTLCVLGLTEAWYRSHEIEDEGVFHWSVKLPADNTTFEAIEMPPRSVKLISADVSITGKWHADDGSRWSVYFFRWEPRDICSVLMSRVHRPEVCLPASGLKQKADGGLVFLPAGQFELPFRRYTYDSDGRTLHVFFCQWEDGSRQQTGMGASGQLERWRSVLVGRRKVGNQSLEIIIEGPTSLEEAEEILRQRFPELIAPEPQPARRAEAQTVGREYWTSGTSRDSLRLRACLKIARGAAARGFGRGQGGEPRASPQWAVRAEPTRPPAKRTAARRVSAGRARWLRGSSVIPQSGTGMLPASRLAIQPFLRKQHPSEFSDRLLQRGQASPPRFCVARPPWCRMRPTP